MAIGTAAAIGLGISAASAGASFAQAGKQNRLQRQAQADAEKAMVEAKKQLEVNYFKQLGINKEPYELQREAMLTQGAQSVEAAKEADRGVAAAAGRIQMAQNEAQAGIRSSMGQEMAALDKLVANQDAALAQQRAGLSLEESAGAQKAAALAGARAAQATTQGMQSVQNLGQTIYQAAPLYSKTGESATKAVKGMEQNVALANKYIKPIPSGMTAEATYGRTPMPTMQDIVGVHGLSPSLGTAISPSMISPTPTQITGMAPWAAVGGLPTLPYTPGGNIDWSKFPQ